MNIKAEINAAVEVFVADLTKLVRQVAIEGVRRALAGPSQATGAGRAQKPVSPQRRAGEPAATRRGRPTRTEATAGPRARTGGAQPTSRFSPLAPPAERRQAIAKQPERGLSTRRTEPSRAAGQPPPPAERPAPPAPRIIVLPPVRARVRRAKATPAPKPPVVQPVAAPAEALPAARWVVVRRPARDRQEPTSTEAAPGAPDPTRGR